LDATGFFAAGFFPLGVFPVATGFPKVGVIAAVGGRTVDGVCLLLVVFCWLVF
jgi:hypothetical protein